jgi:hypothetical protein
MGLATGDLATPSPESAPPSDPSWEKCVGERATKVLMCLDLETSVKGERRGRPLGAASVAEYLDVCRGGCSGCLWKLVASTVESERWILVCQQCCVSDYSQYPAIQAND